jgi:CheY-like chemotaxis protein
MQEVVNFMIKSRNYIQDLEVLKIGMILMDWSMPVMEGCQVIQGTRKLGIDVPIVALTDCVPGGSTTARFNRVRSW